MRVDTSGILSSEDKEARNSVTDFITNMYKLVEYAKAFGTKYEVADISRLKPFTIDDYSDYGTYNALTITPHSIFRNEVYSGETTMLTWEQVWNNVNKTVSDLKEHNLSNEFFRKHYVMRNGNLRYAMGEGQHINFTAVKETPKAYFDMLKATEHLNIFQTRFVADFYLDKGLELDEAIASVEMPKEWFIAMFSDLAVNDNNSPF